MLELNICLDLIDVEKLNQEGSSTSEGSEWAELFVREMLSASNLDDAKDRATRALEAFEKTVLSRSGSVLQEFQKVIVLAFYLPQFPSVMSRYG